MFRRGVQLVVGAALLGATMLSAQTTTCGTTKLACLLPTALHTNPPTFNYFNTAFATQIGELPLATPASGFVLVFDSRTGVYGASRESYGPLVAERAETIGQRKAYVAFTYQRFHFSQLDGNSLDNLPLLFSYPSTSAATVLTQTMNKITANVDQYAVFATYGVSNRADVSVAIPIQKVTLNAVTTGSEFSTTTTATASFTQTLNGSASGLGDVVFAAKGTLYRHERYGIAVGGELRVPTGDEQNFLGSGAVGIKPYVVLARRGKVAPHVNLAYQWNSLSSLAANATGTQQPLPAFLGYTFGADAGLKRVTLTADFVGQHFFNAPQITKPQATAGVVNGVPVSFQSVQPVMGGYEVDKIAVGAKVNPWRNVLVFGNVTINANMGGLAARAVPLVGASYSF